MPEVHDRSRLRVELKADRVRELAHLVAALTGGMEPAEFPYLAPALLLADPSVKERLSFPEEPGRILMQEYQSIAYTGEVPTDIGLTAKACVSLAGDSAEYDFALLGKTGRPCARLGTVVRLMEANEVTGAKPARFGRMLGDTRWGDEIPVSQTAVDAYLALSGDDNPVHRPTPEGGSPDRAIVPGLLLGSLIQPYCEAASPGKRLQSLKIRFMAPLFAGDAVRFGVQPRGETQDGSARLRAYLAGIDDRALAVADLLLTP